MIKVIGKEGCSRCLMVKNLLNNKKIEFEYFLLNELSQEEQNNYLKMAKEVGMTNLPLVIKDNKIVEIKEVL